MTDLTEASLEKLLEEFQEMTKNTGGTITLRPTKLIFRPSDLAVLGLTVDDVKKMIRENQ